MEQKFADSPGTKQRCWHAKMEAQTAPKNLNVQSGLGSTVWWASKLQCEHRTAQHSTYI